MLAPRDEADVAEIIAMTRGALEPIAGGTKRAVGRPVAAQALDLTALCGIVSYEPGELVLTARAATPLDVVERALAEHSQRLSFEPPDWTRLLGAGGRPTIGGVLAANLAGSRRVTAGAARDHFLGLRAVSGLGECFKAGGRVVKNVTGYDLPKLLAGSWGTLAVLTEVSVRVHPAPEHERTLLVRANGAAAAVRCMSAALGSAAEVSAAAFRPRAGVALRLEGFRVSVEARAQSLLAELAGLGVLGELDGRGELREHGGLREPAAPEASWLEDADSAELWRALGAVHALADWPVVWRLSVPPSAAARVIERLAPEDYLLDWGGGLIWIGAHEADAGRVRGAIESGHATLVKASAEVRAACSVFQPPPAPLAEALGRLKAAFDPDGRLNPGRMD